MPALRPLAASFTLLGLLAATAPADETPTLVLRAYDVADLLAGPEAAPNVDRSPFGGGGGGGGQRPSAGDADAGFAQRADALLTLIKDVAGIEPVEGVAPVMQVAPSGTVLVVRQTDANHARVHELLRALREAQAATPVLRVRLDWVELDAVDATSAGPATRPSDESPDAVFARARPYAAAEATCYAGRAMDFVSSRDRVVVTDVTPVVGQASAAYDPVTDVKRSGVTVHFTPGLLPDKSAATLDLHGRVVEMAADPMPAAPPADEDRELTSAAFRGVLAALGRADTLGQDVAVATRLPLGRRTSIATLTLPPDTADGVARHLALWARVDVVR